MNSNQFMKSQLVYFGWYIFGLVVWLQRNTGLGSMLCENVRLERFFNTALTQRNTGLRSMSYENVNLQRFLPTAWPQRNTGLGSMSCMALYKLCPCLDSDAFDAVASSFVMSTFKLFPFSASFISSSYVCQSYDVKICYRPQGKIMFSEAFVCSWGSPSSIQGVGISVYRGVGDPTQAEGGSLSGRGSLFSGALHPKGYPSRGGSPSRRGLYPGEG